MINLRATLRPIPKDQLIKVGSSSGNAWWYVGNVRDLLTHEQEINDSLLSCIRKGVNNQNSWGNHYPDRYLTDFIPILKRKVVSCTPSDPAVDRGCLRIVVQGCERGGYWHTKEAECLPSWKPTGIIVEGRTV